MNGEVKFFEYSKKKKKNGGGGGGVQVGGGVRFRWGQGRCERRSEVKKGGSGWGVRVDVNEELKYL